MRKYLLSIFILTTLITTPIISWANTHVSTGDPIVTGNNTATISGTVTDLVNYNPGTAWLAYGLTTQAFPNVFYVTPNASGYITKALTGLTPGTAYHTRICGYFTGSGTECGDTKNFTTTGANPVPPSTTSGLSVATYVATNVSDMTATLNGWAKPDNTPTTAYFRYSEMPIPPVFCNDIYGNNMLATEDIKIATTSSFSETIYDLSPDTTYYFCAVASSKTGIAYGTGEVRSFKTLPCPGCASSGVETKPATAITDKFAVLNGKYSTKESATIWFEYGKNNTLFTGGAIKVNTQSVGQNASGNISFSLTGLTANTIYRYRFVIKKSSGEVIEGGNVTFKTKVKPNPCPPDFPGGGGHGPATIVSDSILRMVLDSTPIGGSLKTIGSGIPVIIPIIPRPIGPSIPVKDPCDPYQPDPKPYYPPGGGTNPGGDPNIPVIPGTSIPVDAIVRFQEGVEHVFVRQIIGIPSIARAYGYTPDLDLTQFANDLAHKLAQIFGYYDKKKEIRVLPPDIAAYELKLGSDGLLMVKEYYAGILISSRKINDGFKKPPENYEYNYKGL